LIRRLHRAWSDDRAAQIAEFALSLPLLVVFVVGIFDFSGAFILKQKLTNAARDAARAAAADPSNDLSNGGTPASVSDAFQVVENYFLANNLNDCGIIPGGPPTGLTWVYSAAANGCPPGGLILTINRGYYFPQNGAALPSADCRVQPPNGQLTVVATCVSIRYAYKWQFNRVIGLLVRGATSASLTTITTTAVVINEN
jgi:hypothetical protein